MITNPLTYERANEYELGFLKYGIDPIENYILLRKVVNALYSEDATIIINDKTDTVQVVHEIIRNGSITYRWV